MFPLEFPLQMLADAPRGSRVLDPFCGRGTTNYAARLLGHHSYGTDTNPVAVAIAKAKLAQASIEQILSLLQEILAGPSPSDVPQGRFWELCYHPETLQNVCKLREGLQGRMSPAADLLRAVFLGVLHGPKGKKTISYLSNQMPRTFASKPTYSINYWSSRNMYPHYVNVAEVIERKARRVLASLPPPTYGRITLNDARYLPQYDDLIDYIITSPPYYGMDTYRPDQWLRYWALGNPAEVPYQDDTQVSRGGLQGFTDRLAAVWRRVGEISRNQAKLCVRFGSVPSKKVDPFEILEESFVLSGQPWFVVRVSRVPRLDRQSRQATQMGDVAQQNDASYEIDVIATLDRG